MEMKELFWIMYVVMATQRDLMACYMVKTSQTSISVGEQKDAEEAKECNKENNSQNGVAMLMYARHDTKNCTTTFTYLISN